MNLATRCPSCGTVFRVVPDQLRVSSGWVRCGRCSGVFDANQDLFDIDRGAPARTASRPDDRGRAAGGAAGRRWGDVDTSASPARPSKSRAAPVHVDIVITDHVPPPPPPSSDWPPLGAAAEPDDAPASLRATVRPTQAFSAKAKARSERRGKPPVLRAGRREMPSFLRVAERHARWQQPAVRAALATAAAMLAALLAAQAMLLWRDVLAAQAPGLRPAIEALCALAGCRVEPLRRIDSLSVDSSALARLDATPGAADNRYRLSLLLHNRADTALMMPALELSLTDAQGQLIARRVLRMGDLGAAQTVIAAGQELPLRVLLGTGEHRVEGYTVELFYP